MASFDFASLSQPVSADEPCGPDLDLAGDPDFAQFVARSEGIFPASFFTRDNDGKLQAFDRSSIDFGAEFKALGPLLETTRDLRLLTIYGRLLALNRDLAGFTACIEAVAALIRDRWDDVNPRGEEGDYSLRGAVLQAFDDTPTIVLPLQHMPLVESRRAGAITYRTVMVASGEVKARDDEPVVDRPTIDRALAEADLDSLKTTSERLHKIVDATGIIQVTSIEKAGYDQAVTLDKLPALVSKMAAFVDGAIAARDPNAAQPAASPDLAPGSSGGAVATGAPLPAAAVPTGRIASVADAAEALAALAAYFRQSEPSSPGAILVRQAQRLMGKPFPEVVRLLLPDYASNAKIQLGADKLFGLTFEQFSDSSDDLGNSSDAAPGWTETESPVVADAPPGHENGDASDGAPPKPPIQAKTRPEAASLLEQVSAFYRTAEPSSPIPLFTERARALIDRDFLTILKDILPELVPAPRE